MRLILIEGMIGAGKSTIAGRLTSLLADQGEDVHAFHEFAEDHPIRTKAVDRLRAAYPDQRPAPEDAGRDGRARDRGVYAVEQWGRLAELCRTGRRTVVLESTFLQNSVLPAFVNGAPAAKCAELCARIQRQLAPAEPLLVYLRPTDVAAAIDRVHDVRGEPWSSWNTATMAASPWAHGRNLHGRNAVVEFYLAWEKVARDLYERYPFAKILIDDPQDRWDAALSAIHTAARPPRRPVSS